MHKLITLRNNLLKVDFGICPMYSRLHADSSRINCLVDFTVKVVAFPIFAFLMPINFIYRTTTKVTCSIVFTLFFVSATTETIAHLFLTIFYHCQKKDELHQRSLKQLESSSFTILWTFLDGVFLNFLFHRLLSQESLVRTFTKYAWRFSALTRSVDENYLRDLSLSFARGNFPDSSNVVPRWIINYLINFTRVPENLVLVHHPVAVDNGEAPQTNITQNTQHAAAVILGFILPLDHPETIKAFQESDTETPIYNYVTLKAIYVYVFGELKNEQPPSFFKETIINNINKLRRDYSDEPIPKEIEEALSDLNNFTKFQDSTKSNRTQLIFNNLTGVAYPLLSDDFTKIYWPHVISLIPQTETIDESKEN